MALCFLPIYLTYVFLSKNRSVAHIFISQYVNATVTINNCECQFNAILDSIYGICRVFTKEGRILASLVPEGNRPLNINICLLCPQTQIDSAAFIVCPLSFLGWIRGITLMCFHFFIVYTGRNKRQLPSGKLH